MVSRQGEVVRSGIVATWQDGRRSTTERVVTTTTDIRDVPGVGRVDFGNVHFGPERTVWLKPVAPRFGPPIVLPIRGTAL